MRLFGRHIIPSVIVVKALLLVRSVAGIITTCRKPLTVIEAYVFKKKLLSKITLRSGIVVNLSDNKNDIVTFVLVFCRREYGAIGNRKTIIDIGANIGIFSLYAAWQGCEKIIAIEPNTISYNTLVKNIEANNLQHKIEALHIAVSNVSGESIFIPKDSNPENVSLAFVTEQQQDSYETVTTLSLKDIIHHRNLQQIHLLKMDCEGAEFQILLPMQANDLKCIDNIVMEYHDEPQPLISHLQATGFFIQKFKKIIDTRIKVGMIEVTHV
jgi:FkbM family methyltransferase